VLAVSTRFPPRYVWWLKAALEVQRRAPVLIPPDGARLARGTDYFFSVEGASIGPEGKHVDAEDAHGQNQSVGDDATPHPHHDDRLRPRPRFALHDQFLAGLKAKGDGRRQIGNEDEEQDL
jgi:hypothetical protein